MSIIRNPFALFTSSTGAPLDAAFIYIGMAGQNPETNPVTVYWDEAKTIAAAQPLRTVAGTINRNGAAANVYFNGAYSITVKDKNGVVVASDLNRATNPDGFLVNLTAAQVNTALGYVPVNGASNQAQMVDKVFMKGATSNFGGQDDNVASVINEAGSCANMQFIRQGFYGIKLGLDTNNAVALGGYSQGGSVIRVYWDTAGNQVTMGNVTAYSDMRRKTEIKQLTGVTPRLLQMRGFTYLDQVTGQRKIGVGAQEVMKAGYSEAVTVGDDAQATLSVAYGQLALPLLIEYARELETRLAVMQAGINELNNELKGK